MASARSATGLFPKISRICISRNITVRGPPNKIPHGRPDAQFESPGVLGYLMLSVPITTFGLGCWQIKRRKWKLGLVAQLDQKLYSAPVALPDDLSDLDHMEYQPVVLVGQFDHSRELVVAPRMRMPESTGGKGGMTDFSGRQGGHVVTPFKLRDRDLEVLVNRGWVPTTRLDPKTRIDGQISGPIEIVGIYRPSEKRPPFVKENAPKKGMFFYRNVEDMASLLGTSPIYFEADFNSSLPDGPLGGQTNVNLRNQHGAYVATWFPLSALTSYVWYLKFLRPI